MFAVKDLPGHYPEKKRQFVGMKKRMKNKKTADFRLGKQKKTKEPQQGYFLGAAIMADARKGSKIYETIVTA